MAQRQIIKRAAPKRRVRPRLGEILLSPPNSKKQAKRSVQAELNLFHNHALKPVKLGVRLLPILRGKPGLAAKIFQKYFPGPAALRRHLRQKQPVVFAFLNEKPMLSHLNLVRVGAACNRAHYRNLPGCFLQLVRVQGWKTRVVKRRGNRHLRNCLI